MTMPDGESSEMQRISAPVVHRRQIICSTSCRALP